ncbi:hypothetical protein DW095_13895 [Bacteroides sp. AM07-16]|nr:hypothetical protein DW095_13895 [Bacteroides sp. AM07-16]
MAPSCSFCIVVSITGAKIETFFKYAITRMFFLRKYSVEWNRPDSKLLVKNTNPVQSFLF